MLRSASAMCLLLVMLAACGDSATTSTDSSGDAVQPTSLETTAAAAGEVAACALLSAAEVAAATGLDVVEVVEESPTFCVFDLGAEAGVDVFLTMGRKGGSGSAALAFEEYTKLIETGRAEAIAGLGEGAVYAAGFRGLALDAGGGRLVLLGINGGYRHLQDPRDALIELATAALERL